MPRSMGRAVRLRIPERFYWGRPVRRGDWHVYDSETRRTACGTYNNSGVSTAFAPPPHQAPEGTVCPDCADAVDWLEPDGATVDV